jgi:serine/threonine protein kinase
MFEPDPLLGTVLADRFRLLQRIAEGRRGILYRAHCVDTGDPVAVKLVHAQRHETQAGFEIRLSAESEAAAALREAHTLRVHGSGPVDELRAYFAMEWLDGYSVADILEAYGPLNGHQASVLALQVAYSLAHAHRQGVFHGDLTPQSLFVARAGAGLHLVKVMDYGRRRFTSYGDEGQSLVGMPQGWARYLAPEQITDNEPDQRADVFALGAVLYEALTGEHPFGDGTGVGVLLAQVHEQARPLVAHPRAQGVPEEFCQLVQRCLENERSRRFESAEEIVSIVDRLLHSTAAAAQAEW